MDSSYASRRESLSSEMASLAAPDDSRVLTLAEQIIAALPERIKVLFFFYISGCLPLQNPSTSSSVSLSSYCMSIKSKSCFLCLLQHFHSIYWFSAISIFYIPLITSHFHHICISATSNRCSTIFFTSATSMIYSRDILTTII